MSKPIAITGMGIISAIGNSVEENLLSLLQNQTGIGTAQFLKTVHQSRFPLGEVKLSNEELSEKLKLPTDHNFTRTALLGAIAAKEAVKQAGIGLMNDERTGLISATSVGGMDQSEHYFFEYEAHPEKQKYILSHDAGDSSSKIAEILQLKGFTTTISTACSSAANAIMFGARMIQSGRLDRVIVGGTDTLSKFTLNGFNSLMILSDELNRPFDAQRKGLNLGEAAAYLVLESDAMVTKYQKQVLAYLAGYANFNDAYHQTASSETGEGAFLAMQKALEIANLTAEDIDYINAHGTATPNNDASESAAIKRIFATQVPSFSSTKPFTGHTLAAAASVEAVFCILALQQQKVWANLNFETPIPEFGLIPQLEIKTKPIQHVLSNSFGFGGNCSTLIFTQS
ncbi:beta-ketoacyl-[acyl-carrier-protein] synthase family protein [Vaginella massiliensis]|uniref:beta-ketoacyl-[acyl-carrier-protein] synthase family protein n=1 Tax=Vaginella massiliensis TaxID=1816680 RepID=UPI003753070A